MEIWFENSRIDPASTAAEAGLLLGRIVANLGLSRFAYILVSPPRGRRVDIHSTAMTDYPQEWVRRYVERQYALIDPVLDMAAGKTRPYFWTTASLASANPLQRRMLREARDFGIANGLTIPIRCARGAVGAFTAVAPEAERLGEAARDGGGELLASAYDAHEFAVGRILGTRAADIDIPNLSMRERECLLWTLEGKTAEETAMILGLSVFTVNRHAFNATHKLGSLNKHHAAVQALRIGLI